MNFNTFLNETNRGMIWKVQDLSRQIQELLKAKEAGKLKLDTINFGSNEIDEIIKYQSLKADFLLEYLLSSKEKRTKIYEDLELSMCPNCSHENLTCEKDFLKWSQLQLLDEYGTYKMDNR